ncbi:protein RIC-3 [Anarrhichthys ocellatus]|uniref:protein RIC-3 n=1 Tax=Anarrhichthys ocellatus TaxID=433405 RepID=UPI0012ECD0D9|nr:protein RIC-3-like [Anarrhichthys ocellatus]
MSVTTCQKVTLISCSVLCLSLFLPRMLLPRGKKEMGRPEVGPGFYPPVMHHLSLPKDPERWGVDPSYSMAHSAEVMAKVKGVGRGKKYNLMAQAIPIYGFGILLYILYIIYKLTCKGKTTESENHTTVTKENMESEITPEHELVRLQERLLQTERMMERIVSGKSKGSASGRRRKSKTSTSKKEEKLLKQLRQITLLIQEGRLEADSPEMEAEEVPYCVDWEGYPEETYPEYDEPCKRRGFDIFTLEGPPHQPTPEALAERMEQEEEELTARKLSIVEEVDEEVEEEVEEGVEEDQDKEEEVEEVEEEIEEPVADRKQERLGLEVSKALQCLNGGKKQISFSDHNDVFHYPKEGTCEEEEEEEEEKEDEVEEDDEETEVEEEEEADEDDPVMEAESLQFSCEGCPNPEEEAEEDKEEYLFLSEPVEDDGPTHADVPKDVGASGLRMRNRRET